MKQFDVIDAMKIPIDSSDTDIPESAKILRPLVFLEETSEARAYCAVWTGSIDRNIRLWR
jgi:hypothetical protein